MHVLFGVIVAALAFKVLHHRRRWRSGHWHHNHHLRHGGYGGCESFGPSPFGPAAWGPPQGRDFFHAIIDDLHLTREQEEQAREIFKEAKSAAKEAKDLGRDLRGKVVAALRSDAFDETSTGTMLGDFDHVFESTRGKLLNVFSKLYQVLDRSQRSRLADWLERGRGGGGFSSPWASL
jgi:Spy/CpxP family protein refolding chaperone